MSVPPIRFRQCRTEMNNQSDNVTSAAPESEKPVGQPDTRPTLQTERLVLRPFVEQDEAEVFRICREKEIAANTRTIPHPYPRAQAAKWISLHAEKWIEGKGAVFAICTKQDDQMVGSIGLEISEQDKNAELGYLIDKGCWGQGYCSEAAEEVVRFGFETLALHRIHAHCLTTNPASGRVLEKIGMQKEGLLRGHVCKWGVFHDICFYGLLKSEFSAKSSV